MFAFEEDAHLCNALFLSNLWRKYHHIAENCILCATLISDIMGTTSTTVTKLDWTPNSGPRIGSRIPMNPSRPIQKQSLGFVDFNFNAHSCRIYRNFQYLLGDMTRHWYINIDTCRQHRQMPTRLPFNRRRITRERDHIQTMRSYLRQSYCRMLREYVG